MPAPATTRVIFWLGGAACVVGGLVLIVTGITEPHVIIGGQVVAGILFMILGPLVVRIYCTLLIVLYSKHLTL